MNHFQVVVKLKSLVGLCVLVLCYSHCSNAWNTAYKVDDVAIEKFFHHEIKTLDRERRDAPGAAPGAPDASASPAVPASPVVVTATTPISTPPTTPLVPATNSSSIAPDDSNKTTNGTEKALPTAVVTQIPLLGFNGTGIYRGNLTGNMPQVSDPLIPEDNLTSEFFKETPERIQSEHNLTKLNYDNHNFYNSSFIGNVTFFNEYWANITKEDPTIHPVLSNSHRRATTIQLKFNFPFYGHNLRNITVATGGFIYTGDHVHNWLAATQYIAPLMANFDTSLTNDSLVKLYDDGERFTAFWENVTLQEDMTKQFTFAVTLYKKGDIVFAYKQMPLDVNEINDTEHPVKVGISDAYLSDKIMFYIRRKTIYEYHRVSFKSHVIVNNTILWLTALPTCLEYTTCESCLNHKTGFNCTWCPQIQKCSSGTDRNKQDWMLRHCERTMLTSASACAEVEEPPLGNITTYNTTESRNVHTYDTAQENVARAAESNQGTGARVGPPDARSPLGGAVAAFVAVALVCCLAGWLLYAFKNPHTRSGQMLIKYRPSQWNWRRGEARYTAATIHM